MTMLSKYSGYLAAAAAVVASCAGITYLVIRKKYRYKDAADAFSYLNINLVTCEASCDEIINEIRRRCKLHQAVGFDCEWVTNNGKRRPVAMIQLSTFDGLCGMFRMNKLLTMPDSLKDLLEDEKIYKVGVAPIDDAKYLRNDYSVGLKSTLDLRHLALLCGVDTGGLASLSMNLLHVLLDKSWRIRCSDWEQEELTERQIKYAAADAHVAIRIFDKLIKEYQQGFFAKILKTKNAFNDLEDICHRYADIGYSAPASARKKIDISKEPQKCISSKGYPHATRTKPLYHNCFLEAPDGELLCTCDTKKAMWYVEKHLAEIVKREPLTVRLHFEPAGRSVGEVGRYYQLVKENKCVVCGDDNSYIRKNVVPREYRKYFPEIMKEHSSHDVLLLCASCHKLSNSRDQFARARLAADCGAPLPSHENGKYYEEAASKKIRSAARALLYQTSKHVLPAARRLELEQVLLTHFLQHEELTHELLEEAANMPVLIENSGYESHGEMVVEHYLKQDGGLLLLEEFWREHFLRTMHPKYMPKLWSLKHSEERLRVRYNEGRLSEEDIKLIGVSKWI